MSLFRDLLFTVYPPLCEVCGRMMMAGENLICSGCLLELPRTNFHQDPSNPVAGLFWGRVKMENATAWFRFYKGSPFQQLLHKLKYKGRKEIGFVLGAYFAEEIRDSVYMDHDVLIPVPLHPLKLRKRGYNQSEWIARGVNRVFGKTLDTRSLIRTSDTGTQTRKSRFDRFRNMEGKFVITSPDSISGQSILLIDDVVTTGSTLEACAEALLKNGCSRVSAITLAVA